MKSLVYIGAAVTLMGLALAGCESGSAKPTATPTMTHAVTTPAPTVTVTHTVTAKPRSSAVSSPSYSRPPAPSSVPAQQPQQSAPPEMTNPVSVVMQYYQDISDGDYPAAWALGGDNLSGGGGYSVWVSGYRDTTASISITSYGTWSADKVWADISAVQLDGSVKTYSGTYTVRDGVIIAADITQTSLPDGSYPNVCATVAGTVLRAAKCLFSTGDQHTEAQHDALTAAGVDPKYIYVEKASTRLAVRPELEKLRKMLRPGDVLVITKVGRLARSLLDLIGIADELREEGVALEVLSGTFNRDDPMGEAFFQMTGVFAQLERDLSRQRTLEGLEAARARGRTGGRGQKLTPAQEKELLRMVAAKDRTVAEVGGVFGISREAVYGYVRRATKDSCPARQAKPGRSGEQADASRRSAASAGATCMTAVEVSHPGVASPIA